MITIREEGGQVLVSGSYEETFPLTGKLRNRGFSWDSYRRAWSAPRNKLSDRQLENLRDLIGGREQQVASTAQVVSDPVTADERLDLNTEAGQIYWGKTFARLNEMAERFAQKKIYTQRHFDGAAVATEVIERIARNFGLKGVSDATMRRYFAEAAEKEERRASERHKDEARRLSEENLARGWTDEAVAKLAASTRTDDRPAAAAPETAASRLTARQQLERMISRMEEVDEFASRRPVIERAKFVVGFAAVRSYLILMGRAMVLLAPDDGSEEVPEAPSSNVRELQKLLDMATGPNANIYQGGLGPLLAVVRAAEQASESDAGFASDRRQTLKDRREVRSRGLGPGSIEWPSMPVRLVGLWCDPGGSPVRSGAYFQAPTEKLPLAFSGDYLAIAAAHLQDEPAVQICVSSQPMVLRTTDASRAVLVMPSRWSETSSGRLWSSLILS